MKQFKDFFVKFPDGIDGQEKYAIEVLTIETMFAHRNQYLIPDYQRPYSWTVKEVKELVNDIEKSMRESKKWFCGPIFTSQDNFQDNIHYLLDGQQRMTTLFLILRCISTAEFLVSEESFNNLAWSKSDEKNREKRKQESYRKHKGLQEQIQEILTIYDYDKEKYSKVFRSRFQTENSIREKFNDFIAIVPEINRINFSEYENLKNNSTDKYEATLVNLNKNLDCIYKYIKSKLESTDGLDYIIDLGSQIINNLMFIKIPLFKKGDVLDIFETLNSRGKKLALTDLIRFKTLKKLDGFPSESDNIQKKWSEIFQYSGLLSDKFNFFTNSDVFIERFINSFSDKSDGVKDDKERILEFEIIFGHNYSDGVEKMLKSLKSWYYIFDLENGIINNFKEKNEIKTLIELLRLSLKINVNSQVAFLSYLTNLFNLELYESQNDHQGAFAYEIFQIVLTTFSLTTFHNIRSNTTRRIFIEIAKSFRIKSPLRLWYCNFNNKVMSEPKALSFESNFFPTKKYDISSSSFSGIENIILSKSSENNEATYVLSMYNFLIGGTSPNRDELMKSQLDHIMPQRWYSNSCWQKQNKNGNLELKNSIESMKESKLKEVMLSLYSQGGLWSDNSFSNSFIQLIGNKFQIYSKINLDKSNNYWGDCKENTSAGSAKKLIKNTFFNNVNNAFCVPIKPEVWDYEEFKIHTIIERTEIIVEKIINDLGDFKPKIN